MAADTVVFRDAVLLVNGTSLETQFQELTLNYASEMHDRTTFGATTRERKGGLLTASLEGRGLAEFGSDTVESVLFAGVGTTETPVVVFPNGVTEGSQVARGYAMLGVVEKFTIGGPVGALLPFEASIQAAGYGF